MITANQTKLLPNAAFSDLVVQSDIIPWNSEVNFGDVKVKNNPVTSGKFFLNPLFLLKDEKNISFQDDSILFNGAQPLEDYQRTGKPIQKPGIFKIVPETTNARKQLPGIDNSSDTSPKSIPIDLKKKQNSQGSIKKGLDQRSNYSPIILEEKIDKGDEMKKNLIESGRQSVASKKPPVISKNYSNKKNNTVRIRKNREKPFIKSPKIFYSSHRKNVAITNSSDRNTGLNTKIELKNINDQKMKVVNGVEQTKHYGNDGKDQAVLPEKIIKREFKSNPVEMNSPKRKNHTRLINLLKGFSLKISSDNSNKQKITSQHISKNLKKTKSKLKLSTHQEIINQKSKIREKPVFRSKGNHTLNILKTDVISERINLSHLSDVNSGYVNRLYTPVINPSGVSSLALIQRVTQTIFQSMSTGQTHANLIINGKQLGFFEFRYNQDQSGAHVTVVVESEATRNYLQKIIPSIIENLYRKGVLLNSLEVHVGLFDKPNTQKRNNAYHVRKITKSNSGAKISEVDPCISKVRDYGYNTMEILA